MIQSDREARLAVMSRLFNFYQKLDERDFEQRLEIYLIETEEIPVSFLVLAVKLVLREHRYPSLPTIADLWRLARSAAGMDREQYHAGRYLPPPREWPPEGMRHAITAGHFDKVATWTAPQIGADSARALGSGVE